MGSNPSMLIRFIVCPLVSQKGLIMTCKHNWEEKDSQDEGNGIMSVIYICSICGKVDVDQEPIIHDDRQGEDDYDIMSDLTEAEKEADREAEDTGWKKNQ